MGHYVALHDRRLQGGVPGRARLDIVNVDAHTPTRDIVHRIKRHASGEPLRALYILCHGYAGTNVRARTCPWMPAAWGYSSARTD